MCHVHTLSCLDDPDATDDDGGDAYWDRYHDYFRRSVEHAEEVIDALDWPMHDSTLSPVVHCVLQLSRDADLRRRATSLFRRLIAHDRSLVSLMQRRRTVTTMAHTTPTTPSSASPPPPLRTHMLAPADRAGMTRVLSIRVLPDQSAYGYSYERVLSQLFTVEGLK